MEKAQPAAQFQRVEEVELGSIAYPPFSSKLSYLRLSQG